MNGATVMDPAAAARLAAYPGITIGDLYSAGGSAAYEAGAGRDPLEIRELIALVARTEGSILDVAAGAGRLTLPLLTLRRPVTALDLSAAMLAILRVKLDRLPESARLRCTLVEADMTSFRLRERFGSIVLGATSVSLLPDAAARIRMFVGIRAHLAPRGRALVTTVDVEGVDHAPIQFVDGDTVYTVFEWIRPDIGCRTMTILVERDGEASAFTSTVAILPVDVLVEELAAAGLRVVETIEVNTGQAHYRDTIIVATADDEDAS